MDIKLNITDKQSQALTYLSDNQTNTVLYGGSAGGGKSFLGCLWVVYSAIQYPGTRWLIGRSQLSTLKETTLITLLEVFQLLGLKNEKHYHKHADKHIDLWNGSRILFKDLAYMPSDPHYDSLGSLEITGVFVDEITQITEKCFEILKSRIRYKLDQYNIIPKFLGTCNPQKNWVYTRFYLPWQRQNLEEGFEFIAALPGDNPYLSIHYVNELRKLSKTDRARLLEGNWEYQEDGDQLMDQVWFDSWKFTDTGKKYITADIARYGEDSSVIIVWDGFCMKEIIQYQKVNTYDIAKKIKEKADSLGIAGNSVVIDESGIGGGTLDALKSMGMSAIGFIGSASPKRNKNYQNLRQETFFQMPLHPLAISEELKKKKWKIGNKEETIWNVICQELSSIKRLPSDGKPKLISKDKIKSQIGRSPDLADAISLRMYFELQPKWGMS